MPVTYKAVITTEMLPSNNFSYIKDIENGRRGKVKSKTAAKKKYFKYADSRKTGREI